MTAPADLRARLAAAMDRADRARANPSDPEDWPPVTRLAGAPVPPGFTAWRVGGEDGHVTAMPSVRDSAPLEFRQRYMARVVANGTGLCPLCGEAAGISGPDPEHGHLAGYRAVPVTVGITHSPDCPALFTEEDRTWFDPRAVQ
ncbi:hypothetical protein BJF79_23630 [Actinomadura sp. CNU-125]|uniref:hypothetical protein n=1 Tax=Actinomadura sp. CNU-125 TaxID=1904961 RepID=UPI0009627929|nr:hypothetical protein [Actinomadura sp. CNU-125]OLT11716.1 hypothetical protein BJF79_23630 [Actinomadura sp. CNU-125]